VAHPGSSAAERSLAELARSFRDGSVTVESLAEAFLERIAADDPRLQAWVHVDREAALDRARALDRAGLSGRGPLYGMPIGVKDIFDTDDMPTAYGSPIYEGHRPPVDSARVALARGHGRGLELSRARTYARAWQVDGESRGYPTPTDTMVVMGPGRRGEWASAPLSFARTRTHARIRCRVPSTQ
jgi:Amidase